MHTLPFLFSAPVARHNHQLAGTPDGLLNAVQPGEFLVSQRRPEVPIMRANGLSSRRACGFIQPPVEALPRFLLANPPKPFAYIAWTTVAPDGC